MSSFILIVGAVATFVCMLMGADFMAFMVVVLTLAGAVGVDVARNKP